MTISPPDGAKEYQRVAACGEPIAFSAHGEGFPD
jgi:hypothetical protein